MENEAQLSPQTALDLKILKHAINEYNQLSVPTYSDLSRLQDALDDFNFSQKYQAVHMEGACKDSGDLFNLYRKNHNVTTAYLQKHSASRKCFFYLKAEYFSFDKFYSAHKNAFPLYNEFKMVFNTMCYYFWDTLFFDDNGKPCSYFFHKNPFSPAFLLSPQFSFSRESVNSNTRKTNVLNKLKNYYFPSLSSFKIYGTDTKFFILNFRYVKSFTKALNLFSLTLLRACNGHKFPAQDERKAPISRHIAWCVYENRRKCSLLDIECHTSVSCPYYRESTVKKNRNRY